jgi:hypothetical protein
MGNTSNMLGKSVGLRAFITGPAIVGVVLLASCANNVPQDKKTGPDGRIKGAKEMVLENGVAKATGIVTYPGGDRVDWKLLQLPDKKKGTLELKLQWTPPRPGLQLAFDVFDEWNEQLVSSSKKTGKKKQRGRNRTASLDNAKGKYFIRVYAVGRGDAGKYRLDVEFKEKSDGPVTDFLKLEIPDPPKLAAIPDVVEPCTDETFDKSKKECKNFCPESNPPPGWPACDGQCRKPHTIDQKACWAIMDCPTPADMRVKSCKPEDFPPCDRARPDMKNLNCLKPVDPISARITLSQIVGTEVEVTVGAGSEQGVTKAWSGKVVDGRGNPISGGDLTVKSVDKKRSVWKTKLQLGQVQANPNVKLQPK